jgi:hypothetical protein
MSYRHTNRADAIGNLTLSTSDVVLLRDEYQVILQEAETTSMEDSEQVMQCNYGPHNLIQEKDHCDYQATRTSLPWIITGRLTS